MNISPLTIYLWQQADQIRPVIHAIGCFASMVCVGFLLYCVITDKGYNEPLEDFDARQARLRAAARPHLFRAMRWAAFVWSIFIFTPKSDTIAMMVIIPEIAHSKVVQQDLPDVYNAAVEALKQALKGVKP